MSDDSVRAALRSDGQLVVIEAPAGCGKTHQGADYACDLALANSSHRLLILTHTHAACSVFSERTKDLGARVEIRTLDSVIAQVANIYHDGLGLPSDTALWVRQQDDGHALLAQKVVALIRRHPMIAATIAARHGTVVCDEHQDSSGDQHAFVMALHEQRARIRIFADPMQKIFKETELANSCPLPEWSMLTDSAHQFERLTTPHRWKTGCSLLGQWTLNAREVLRTGGRIDLTNGLPPSVKVVYAENQAQRNLDYQLAANARKPIDDFEKAEDSLLILTRHNDTAQALRAFFNRRLQLWEGHTRPGLEKLVAAIDSGNGNGSAIAASIVTFMADVGKGFSPSAFGNRFEQEVSQGCTAQCRGKPATIQELARFLVTEPNHLGVAKMLRRLSELKDTDSAFQDIALDCNREFWDAIRLGNFETTEAGLTEITHRRTYSRPKPPDKAISTIHKAKGLECGSVILLPCDAKTFPDKQDARCLLYVALSRAKNKLMLVVSKTNPSPLFDLGAPPAPPAAPKVNNAKQSSHPTLFDF